MRGVRVWPLPLGTEGLRGPRSRRSQVSVGVAVWAHFLSNTTDWKTERCSRCLCCASRKTLCDAFHPGAARAAGGRCHTVCWAIIIKAPREGDSDATCGGMFQTVGWKLNESINQHDVMIQLDLGATGWITWPTDNLWGNTVVSKPWSRRGDSAARETEGMGALWWPQAEPSGCKTHFFFSNQRVKNRVFCCSKICIMDPIEKKKLHNCVHFNWFTRLMEADWRSFDASGCCCDAVAGVTPCLCSSTTRIDSSNAPCDPDCRSRGCSATWLNE